ncbi:MAG: aminotransferase class V-fold PLP-dependent enzyme [Acidobacteria bacterium]|nr:aminotransferase class V-fold PLP-dependent enzyme [Acidobacteriota bacterium]
MVIEPATTKIGVDRRQFARMLAGGTSAWILGAGAEALASVPLLAPTPAAPDERFWTSVREQFLLPPDLAVINAANLCPASAPVVQALVDATRDVDRDPSPANRVKMSEGKETTRRLLAEFLRVTPEEIVITRNTSEANNLVSSGLDLKAGDEVVIFGDNHPSLHAAWRDKAQRFGYTVRAVEQVNPHPGAEYYLDAFARQMTPRTKVVAFSHLTNTVGDLLPAKELCRLARERGAMSVVDGAQTLGLLDVNLSDMQPDFYSGSAHKWPCGAREAGVLFASARVHDRIWPSIISLYAGAVGISKKLEGLGQRDEAAIIAFGEALRFQTKVGRGAIEARGRELAQALMAGLGRLDGVKVWTHAAPARSAAVVSFRPGNLDASKLAAALYERDRIVGMPRGGQDRGGLRLSPHFYNLHTEVERTIEAVRRYLRAGI